MFAPPTSRTAWRRPMKGNAHRRKRRAHRRTSRDHRCPLLRPPTRKTNRKPDLQPDQQPGRKPSRSTDRRPGRQPARSPNVKTRPRPGPRPGRSQETIPHLTRIGRPRPRMRPSKKQEEKTGRGVGRTTRIANRSRSGFPPQRGGFFPHLLHLRSNRERERVEATPFVSAHGHRPTQPKPARRGGPASADRTHRE
jgi:hypothetical protein